MNLDINVRHLMDLVDQGVDLVRSFVPPPPAGPAGALPDSNSFPHSSLASDGDASLLLPVQPSGKAGLLQNDGPAAQQGEHPPHENLDSNQALMQSPLPETAVDSAAADDAVHDSIPVRLNGAPQADTAGAQGQEQSGFDGQAEVSLAAKPGKTSGGARHGPRVRSMLQPTANGRMSTRPLAHVPAGVTRLPATSLRDHSPRLIRKQRSS